MDSTIRMYRHTFNKLINILKQKVTDNLTPELTDAFVSNTLSERTGQYSSEKVRLRTRYIQLLKDYLDNRMFLLKIYKKVRNNRFARCIVIKSILDLTNS